MIDHLDSRALRKTDCYGQRFMKPGTYRYNVLPVLGHCVTDERPYTITAVERAAGRPAEMAQHTLAVRADRGRFRVEPADELIITVGDMVLWNCRDATAVPYAVVGDQAFFASDRLLNESGYTHAFAAAGEYRWTDAYGSGVAGVVRVQDPCCKDAADFQRWREALARGTLVMIADGKAEPAEVDLVTGQTVFFAVVKGAGISITDVRLLEAAPPREPPIQQHGKPYGKPRAASGG